jgi:hypothetical protein
MIQMVGRCIAAEVKREKRRVTSDKIPGLRPLAYFSSSSATSSSASDFGWREEEEEEEEEEENR